MSVAKSDIEKIYGFIWQHTSGVALETLAKQYQVSPENPAVLISTAELLADGEVKTEMRGGKVYCVAVETDIKECELRKEGDISCRHV